MGVTKKQLEGVQIDYGIVYVNYGESDARRLAPTRGGGEFSVEATIRDIEFDGARGKEKGTQVVDDINAILKVVILDTSMENLALAMPYATLEGDGSADKPYKISCSNVNIGVISEDKYLKNITMFAKTIKGNYKKITLYNAMSESGFGLTAAPKSEGEIALEVYSHWDPENENADLYSIEEIENIVEPA